MPEGIIATVDGGYATLDFVDRSLKGPSLDKLIEAGGPGIVETISRSGPRRKYRVPEGNAREAGLIDDDVEGAVYSAGHDSGNAERLQAANAEAIEVGAVTRPDAPTSANAYVGQTTAAEERELAPPPQQVADAVTEGFGGRNAAQTTPHVDVISTVLDASTVRAVGGVQPVNTPTPDKDYEHPAAAANLGLADQYAGLADREPTYVEGGQSNGDYTPNPSVQDVTSTHGSTATVADDAPEGEPSEDWKRADLNAYASAHGVDNPASLPNKGAVLDAINAKEAEK